jgi:phosphohistidine swiveling domain-containing protein
MNEIGPSIIVAREHRVPTVIAAGRATRTLCDRDVVTVDGTGGVVVVELRAGCTADPTVTHTTSPLR